MCRHETVTAPRTSGSWPVLSEPPLSDDEKKTRDLNACLGEMRETLIRVALARHTLKSSAS